MSKSRSTGVTVLAILLIALGTFRLSPLFFRVFHPVWGARTVPLLAYVTLYGLVTIIAGIGILKLKSWARIATMILVAESTIRGAVGSIADVHRIFARAQSPGLGAAGVLAIGAIILLGLLGVGIIYFLTRPGVRGQFSR